MIGDKDENKQRARDSGNPTTEPQTTVLTAAPQKPTQHTELRQTLQRCKQQLS